MDSLIGFVSCDRLKSLESWLLYSAGSSDPNAIDISIFCLSLLSSNKWNWLAEEPWMEICISSCPGYLLEITWNLKLLEITWNLYWYSEIHNDKSSQSLVSFSIILTSKWHFLAPCVKMFCCLFYVFGDKNFRLPEMSGIHCLFILVPKRELVLILKNSVLLFWCTKFPVPSHKSMPNMPNRYCASLPICVQTARKLQKFCQTVLPRLNLISWFRRIDGVKGCWDIMRTIRHAQSLFNFLHRSFINQGNRVLVTVK